jgi:hypothetical protein
MNTREAVGVPLLRKFLESLGCTVHGIRLEGDVAHVDMTAPPALWSVAFQAAGGECITEQQAEFQDCGCTGGQCKRGPTGCPYPF